MPSASATIDNWEPMLPYPMMPSVRPRTSCDPTADLSQMPACMSRLRSVSRRAMEMISAMASSTTERVLEYGALNTATPWSVAASRSIWLVPMQKAPMALSRVADSRTLRVTYVRDRMPR